MLSPQQLIEIRKSLGLNQEDFGRKIGYSREVVSKVENEKMEPSRWFIEAVLNFRNDQEFERKGSDVKFLGKVSQNAKKDARPYFAQRQEQKTISQDFWVPLVGIKAQAGYVKGFEQTDFLETLDKYSLPPGVNPAGAVWRYFEIDGDSMEPSLSGGDVVLATMVPQEDWNDIRNYGVYVVHTRDQMLIKRVYKKSDHTWVLISDNEEANPQSLLPVEEVKQLWLFRRHIRSKIPQPERTVHSL
jgi:phage repressor protein C with HTH and peptisase S24 domain